MNTLNRTPLILALLTLLALPATRAEAFDHKPYQGILSAFVKRGRVDYAGIRNDAAARARLNGYVTALGAAKLAGKNRNTQLAFYLNAYNAIVIKTVVDRWPVTSVMKVKGFFKRIKHRVAGQSVTLDQLENRVIRPRFKEPRIHFALVCAARSCPPLSSSAFSAATLNRALERLTRAFINGSHGVRVRGDKAWVSRLFTWYEGDFSAAAGTAGKYLARYHKKHGAVLARGGYSYLPYDWSINKK